MRARKTIPQHRWPEELADTEAKIKKHDFKVLKQSLSRQMSPPTSKKLDRATLWARIQLDGEDWPCFDTLEKHVRFSGFVLALVVLNR